jgi:hypothetical protein
MRADNLISFLSILLKKHDMAPRRSAKAASVVVGISRPRETVIRHLIPFFARDFASFAANANARVSEEADFYFFLHEIVMALVRAFSAFADHGLCAGFAVDWAAEAPGVPFATPSPAKIRAHSCPSVA